VRRRSHTFSRVIRVLRFAVAMLVGAIAFPRIVHAAEPFDPGGIEWEGCSRFVQIAQDELGASRIVLTEELDYEALSPSDGVILLHPLGSYDLDELSQFMKSGGRVAVLDDFGDGNALLDRFSIQRGPAPTDPLQMLHGNPQLPVAIPSSSHPIVADVSVVVLNHPTTVRHANLSTLLRIPRAGGDAGPDVALAGQVGEGRLVAFGDPSMFINSMMRYPGNRTVAKNLVRYLVDGAENKRSAKITIVHGHFRERGTLGGGISGTLRDRLRGFLGALDAVRREGFTGAAARVVAFGILAAAAAWALARAALRTRIPRARFAGEPGPDDPPLEDPRIAALLDEGGRFALFGRGRRPSVAGLQVLVDAIDAAIGEREELSTLDRASAVGRLASEAGLAPADVSRVNAAYARLRAATAGVQGGAIRASRREVALFGTILGAHSRGQTAAHGGAHEGARST
jgi:hypothetical protein